MRTLETNSSLAYLSSLLTYRLTKLVGILSVVMVFMISAQVLGAQTASKSCCSKASVEDKEACCAKQKEKEKASCCSSAKAEEERTSGCTPSNCRGATTKFGEAQVITDLRNELISLKAIMEKSEDPKFEFATYAMHGIVGQSDEESMAIIAEHLKIIEEDIQNKLKSEIESFELPKSKAKQIGYLQDRIDKVKTML